MDDRTHIEEAAFRAYAVFIRGAIGTRMFIRDKSGKVVGEESFEQATERRWLNASQATKDEFIAYALAMEPVLARQEHFA
jgi:hypothetical protein